MSGHLLDALLEGHDTSPRVTAPGRRHLRTALLGVTACLVVLVLLPVAGALYVGRRLSGDLTRIDGITRVDGTFDGLTDRPPAPAGPARDAVDVLVIGTDRRSEVPTTGSDARAAAWVGGAQRSDALMILHIAADRRSAALVSIPRDTWVTVPGYGMHKVNAAYSFGGPSLAVATVELLTSVRIDHVAIVDWAGFAALVDSVGGIDVTVPDTVTDSARGTRWLAGTHHLDGAAALEYVGQRYGLPRGDLDRVARQQVVLRTLMEAALHQEMRTDPRMVREFLADATRHLSIDAEWSTAELVGLAASLRNFTTADLTYLTMPVARLGTEAGGQSVVYVDRPVAAGLWGALVTDDVDDWAAARRGRLTPAVVS